MRDRGARPEAGAAPVLPGEVLAGKYKVERILGKGGMGIVVAARHLELEERVAIKFLLRGGDRKNKGTTTERFLREARAAAKVKSEHVCRVFDVARLDTGEPYLVMEYLEGTDLSERLGAAGPLAIAQATGILIETCAALAEAHALGIIHRDLKPANIFLAKRPDGTTCVKVLDFGISKWTSSDAMTSTTALIGSPAYMSPEQIESARTVDARADIWSLGVVLHELLTGVPPFVADTVLQLSVKIREQPPSRLADILPSAPPALSDVVAKCLAKEPADRYADVRDLAIALGAFAEPDARRLADRIRRGRGPIPSSSASSSSSSASSTSLEDSDVAVGGASLLNEPSVEARGDGHEGQITLEPLSRVSSAEDQTPKIQKPRRWPSLGAVAIVVAVAGLLTAWRFSEPHAKQPAVHESEKQPSTTSSSLNASPSTDVPLPSIMTTSSTSSSNSPAPPPSTAFVTPPLLSLRHDSPQPQPSPAAPSTPARSSSSSAPPSAAVDSTAAPSLSAAPVPVPAAEASGRRKRSLDRSDPYD